MATGLRTLVDRIRGVLGREGLAALGDADLVRRYADGRDEVAFAELVHRHAPAVYAACRRHLRDADELDDAFQAVFVALARKAGTLRSPDRLSPWLCGVADRVARTARFRAARRAAVIRPLDAVAEPAVPAAPDADLRGALDEELARLPPEYRRAVTLCDVDGVSRRAAADRLGVPESTLSNRLTRARAMLGRRLLRRGVALGAGLTLTGVAVATVPARLVPLTVSRIAADAVPPHILSLASAGVPVMPLLKTAGALLAGLVLAASLAPLAAQAVKAPPPVQAKNPADPPEPPDPEPEEGGFVMSAAYSRDGRWLALAEKKHDYLGCGEDRITVFDAATWKPKHRLKVDEHHCRSLRLSPDGNTLFAAFTDGVIHTWDTKTGQAGAKLEPKEAKAGSIFGLALTPDGKILASGYHDQKAKKSGIHLWDVATGKPLRTLTSDATLVPSVITVSPDGKTVAGGYRATHQDPTDVAGFHGVIEWDVATGKETSRLALPRITAGATPIVCEVAYTPDGKRVVVAGGEAVPTDPGACACVGFLWVLDRKTGKAERTLVEESEDYVRQVALSADGKKLYATTKPPLFAVLHCWDTATWDQDWSRQGGNCISHVLVVAPNGKRVGWGGDMQRGFNLFDAATGDPKGGLVNLPK